MTKQDKTYSPATLCVQAGWTPTELPRHTVYATGDTIITSGYSAVFPAGLPVGTIIDDGVNHNQNFFTLRIKLFADFARLSNVQVVVDNYRDELVEVEANTIVNSDPTKK